MFVDSLPAHLSPYPPPCGRPLPEGKGLCDTRETQFQNSAALYIFMRRTIPVEPSEPFEPV